MGASQLLAIGPGRVVAGFTKRITDKLTTIPVDSPEALKALS
ncbi:hypothetical protein ACIQWN_36800 [Streptomyces vinaceus]